MMFVVKTIQKLVEAIGKNADEVIIVGGQAPEILEAISRPAAGEDRNPLQLILSKLQDSFEVLELVDNSQQVEGILRQKQTLR